MSTSTKQPEGTDAADRIHRDEDGVFWLDEETKISEDAARKAGWSEARQSSREGEQPDPEDRATNEGQSPHREAVETAAESAEKAKEMSTGERMDAVEWFLSPEPEESVATRQLELNVSTDPSMPKYIDWTVQALPRERIQEIRDKSRKQAAGRRRRGADMEEGLGKAGVLANLRIAAEGTLYPNLRDEKIRGDLLDPADVLSRRFAFKPGLIDQISAHVIEVSGYDEDDVREVDAVKNS